MLVSLIANKKTLIFRVVSRTLWLEVAAWMTSRSAHKGWSIRWRAGGPIIVTPWIGAGVTVSLQPTESGSRS